ncbi:MULTISPECIES: DUF2304 domain-containing protein [unclassified Lactococcus]|uniref:DUF2304 domain-containing protein n=1 Tax=unclassified Lactococcus TaxID=2643510 RepID=UPI0011C76F4A|nr:MULTISPECIES: DUF2304 domain-containing protein [unclassified Lactococcus]MQW22817.1 DUF2304 family protein [Lactococcus sp. dk101]TXK44820.1 DUF2304 domain-containing protein [Lactococcus sp. dk310]TXK50714.1 DUF2304 domain-containing protein [Lactococcus sp. dk322]
MPVQLRILSIVLALAFLAFTVRLVRKDRAEIRHMLKWLFLAIVILLGAIFPEIGSKIARFMGIHTLASLTLFTLVGILIIISILFQLSLVSAEKQITNLVQEISLLKKRVNELEEEKSE